MTTTNIFVTQHDIINHLECQNQLIQSVKIIHTLHTYSLEAEVYCPSWIMFNWRRPILTSFIMFINLLKGKEAKINFLLLWKD